MMRRFVSRCRMVAPPSWAAVMFVLILGVIRIPQNLLGNHLMWQADAPTYRFLVLGSIVLGVYRAVAFHPYFRPNYLRWLRATPWHVHKPLPLGPVELVPEDVVGIGLILLLGTVLPQRHSVELLNTFLISHILALVVTLWRTGAGAFGYAVLFLLGFVPLMSKAPWLALLVLTATYLVIHEGLWHALRGFPWETEGFAVDIGLLQTTKTDNSCGWLFDRLHRDITTARGISRIDALLGCMLVSWWLFAIELAGPDSQ